MFIEFGSKDIQLARRVQDLVKDWVHYEQGDFFSSLDDARFFFNDTAYVLGYEDDKPGVIKCEEVLRDSDGRLVYEKDLHKFPGYSSFEGGKTLFISYIEANPKGEGHGSRLLDLLKERYAMIEAKPCGTHRFFSENGFVRTGLYARGIETMVWNK